jgi:hypothetical protein
MGPSILVHSGRRAGNVSSTVTYLFVWGWIAILADGAFYNFPIQSRLAVGIDGRVLYCAGPHGGTTAAAALRIGFVPVRVPLRPYLEIGGRVVSAVR